MNRIGRFLIASSLLFCQGYLYAQQADRKVYFSNGAFLPAKTIGQPQARAATLQKAGFEQQYYLLVQFDQLPTPAVRERLLAAGVDLHTYLPGNAYLATIHQGFSFATAPKFNIISIDAVPAFYKISPELQISKGSGTSTEKNIAVSFYPGLAREIVIQQLQLAGALVVPTKYNTQQVVFINASPGVIKVIAEMPFISGMRYQSTTDKLLNYNNVGVHGIGHLNRLNGRNLNGKGVTIGIGDNADIATHIDFAGRLINRSPWIPADHGTHVAGTAGGAGIRNIKNRGMAPRATLINQFFSNIITDAPVYVTDNNMVVTNNSYYTVEDGCPGNGAYDVLSTYVDQQAATLPQLLHVMAAGNDGTRTCSPYPSSFGTVKSGWQSAKNTLAVGAINTDDFTIANFSSRGPLNDGRLKPEIVAGGWAISSTLTNNNYGLNWGTSMSAPVVTGTLALMNERFRQVNAGANPPAFLMKAIVCNTAQDLGNAGPDFTYGFGMVDARRAVEGIEGNQFFINSVVNGGNSLQQVTVPANTRRLKILLYWPDAPAATNAAFALVNDLDLSVVGPGGTLYQPLVLNANPGSVNSLSVPGIDRINNIEQVVIDNPPAGTYTLQVNGFSVPFGPQQYAISYDFHQPSVTVEYPTGDEKWVPGETENIRWSAYGDESNTFTVAYSVNNGANWTELSNNVPATSRKFTWVVPAGLATHQALVRVSRNGGALSDESDASFTILNSPLVTITNVCEGAVQLNWNAITNATGYDILQLSGDSMQVIGSSVGNFFLVKGLEKSMQAWFAVAAKNGAATGRRSIAVAAIPSGGACTLADFNYDVKVDTLLDPTSARQGFSNEVVAAKPVSIRIRNLGAVPVTTPFTVSYKYNNTTITEPVNQVIAAGGSITYTFTGSYPVLPNGYRYDFAAWITLPEDGNHLNDTAYKTVQLINNSAVTSLPLIEDFESMALLTLTTPTMAIGGNDRFDFSGSTSRARLRSFVNTGVAYAGTRAITLDQSPYNDIANTDTLTVSYNLANYVSKQMRFSFYYKNHGQPPGPGNKVWLRGSENSAWIEACDLFANQAMPGQWKQAVININEVMGNAVPLQNVSPTFQLKIGQQGNTSANSAVALDEIDDGYTIDNLHLNEVFNDVGLSKLVSPGSNGCSLGAAQPVTLEVKNYNNTTLNNISVSYQVNGGLVVVENIAAINANQTLTYTFNQTANLAAFIDYHIRVWINYPGDTYAANDSILNFSVRNGPTIAAFPYLQDFETSNGYFYTAGANSSWQWGEPANGVINKAASGTKAWITNLAGKYNNNETSYLYSPCFNVQGMSQPVLSFSHIVDVEEDYDYSWVEYSTDGGSWQKLGTSGTGTNWYDEAALNLWSAPNTRWHVASIDLPLPATVIRFRFVMNSDVGLAEEGIGIDDIHIFDKAAIYTGIPITSLTQPVNSTGWVHFTSGGNRVVSVYSNGNLGPTTAQVHPFAGPVRFSNNEYYANRNIVLRSTIAPVGKVVVRLYFTAAEAQALLNASGCISCNKPFDAYELGITSYRGTIADENGVLADDTSGYFTFIPASQVQVVPYDNGYYAEFSVDQLGEFWLSVGNIQPAVNGICPGSNLLFTVADGAATYQWQENSGSGFVNISDGLKYDGSNTSTFQLLNPPGSFSGYRYRCIINGTAGSEFVVRFRNVWLGSAGTNWFDMTNWSCGRLPDQYTAVIIPGGLTNYPLLNTGTTIKSILVQPGANVTVAAGAVLQVVGR